MTIGSKGRPAARAALVALALGLPLAAPAPALAQRVCAALPERPAPHPAGRRLYVRPGVPQKWSCRYGDVSLGDPYGSFDEAAFCTAPGDTLYVRGGTYFGQQRVSVHGAPDRFVLVTEAPGETVVFDGAFGVPGGQAVVAFDNASYAALGGFEIRNAGDGRGLNVLDSHHVVVFDNDIHHNRGQGILLGSFAFDDAMHDALVIRNHVHHNVLHNQGQNANPGVPIGWAASIQTGSTGWQSCVHMTDNDVHDSWGECLDQQGVDTGTVRGNRVRDCFSVYVYLDGSRHITVDGNILWATSDQYNRTSGGWTRRGVGVAISKEFSSPWPATGTIVSNNIIDSVGTGIEYSSWSRQALDWYESLTIAHNTVLWSAPSSRDGEVAAGIAVQRPLTGTPGGVNRIDNNIVYDPPGGSALELADAWAWAVHNNFFPDGFAGTAVDGTNRLVDPMLAGPQLGVADGYRLRSGSPAIGAGTSEVAAQVPRDHFRVARSATTPSVGVDEASSSAPPPPPPPPPVALRGVNLGGAEFGAGGGFPFPGVHQSSYIYPVSAFQPGYGGPTYFRSKGMNVFRVLFKWERLQRSLFAPLDQAELTRMKTAVDELTATGAQVVLTPYNSARYQTVSWTNPPLILGRDFGADAVADLWGKLAAQFVGRNGVIFGLMNEPFDLEPAVWLDAANLSIQRIRSAEAGQPPSHLILVPGSCVTSARAWSLTADCHTAQSNAEVFGDGLGNVRVVDPANNFAIEVHQYMDASPDGSSDFSGTHPNCAAAVEAIAGVRSFTEWARSHRVRAVLGEFGGAHGDPACFDAVDQLLTHVDSNADVYLGWIAWTGGPWWSGSYPLMLEPQNGADTRTMTAILRHLGGSTAPPPCGNGTCDAGETSQTCPSDCPAAPVCGNGTCDAGETSQSCPSDCPATSGWRVAATASPASLGVGGRTTVTASVVNGGASTSGIIQVMRRGGGLADLILGHCGGTGQAIALPGGGATTTCSVGWTPTEPSSAADPFHIAVGVFDAIWGLLHWQTDVTIVAVSGAPPDGAQYAFEASSQGWSSSGAPITSVFHSSARTFAGAGALAVRVNAGAAGTARAEVFSQPLPGAGATVTFHVYVPATAGLASIQPFVLEGGPGWRWTGTWVGAASLLAGWNTIRVTVPAGAAPLFSLGVEFTTNGGGSSADFFVDAVGW